MSLVVFLRGVNVGGHKTFQPSALAKELVHLDAVSIGAAGTFVIKRQISQAALRKELPGKLPHECELMICVGSDLLKLAKEEPFGSTPADKEVKRYMSVLAKRPSKIPRLPLLIPDDDDWQVKIIGLSGCFVLSLHRRLGRKLIYPNEVVEKQFGTATTRNWNTVETVCALLKNEQSSSRTE